MSYQRDLLEVWSRHCGRRIEACRLRDMDDKRPILVHGDGWPRVVLVDERDYQYALVDEDALATALLNVAGDLLR